MHRQHPPKWFISTNWLLVRHRWWRIFQLQALVFQLHCLECQQNLTCIVRFRIFFGKIRTPSWLQSSVSASFTLSSLCLSTTPRLRTTRGFRGYLNSSTPSCTLDKVSSALTTADSVVNPAFSDEPLFVFVFLMTGWLSKSGFFYSYFIFNFAWYFRQ